MIEEECVDVAELGTFDEESPSYQISTPVEVNELWSLTQESTWVDAVWPKEVEPVSRTTRIKLGPPTAADLQAAAPVEPEPPLSGLRVKQLPHRADVFIPSPGKQPKIANPMMSLPSVQANLMFPDVLDSLTPGTTFHNYQLLEHIGNGIGGATYQGIHLPTGNAVTVKMLDIPNSKAHKDRFENVCWTLSALQHPSICRVLDFIWEWPYVAIVTEFLTTPCGKAPDLTGYCRWFRDRGGALPEDHVVNFGYHILAALHELHRNGIVHGNLKPSNLLFQCILADDDGWDLRLRVADAGIAQILGAELFLRKLRPVISMEGDSDQASVETGAFMSPELWHGEPCTQRTDLYSAGALMHYFLLNKFYAKRPKPSTKRSDIDSGWDPVLGKALRADPERRFGSAVDMAGCLELIGI